MQKGYTTKATHQEAVPGTISVILRLPCSALKCLPVNWGIWLKFQNICNNTPIYLILTLPIALSWPNSSTRKTGFQRKHSVSPSCGHVPCHSATALGWPPTLEESIWQGLPTGLRAVHRPLMYRSAPWTLDYQTKAHQNSISCNIFTRRRCDPPIRSVVQ